MLIVQQILPDERKIERRRRLPSECDIQLGIRGDQLIVDVVDRTEPGGEAQVRRQIHPRLQQELALGGLGLRRTLGHVRATWVRPDVDAQLRVAGAHMPPLCEPVLGRHFGSIGLTVLPEVTAEYWLAQRWHVRAGYT